ncbi:MAG: Nudix family hydrolase [Pseudohongiellaceae bacterium]
MNKKHYLHVAVGVLVNDQQEVLIALRSADSHQGGLWEFPGGKVEQGESLPQALGREFEEELGIRIIDCAPFVQIRHDYPDQAVLLDVWRVNSFSGSPSGKEGQTISWRKLSDLRAADFPKANERIIRALSLPDKIAITPEAKDFGQMCAIVRQLLAGETELIYFRQKEVTAAVYLDWFKWADEQCTERGVRLMYCHPAEVITADALPCLQALHVSARQLRSIHARPTAAEHWFSASCHSLSELRLAEALDADFALLSPVCRTEKYQDSQLLAWAGFQSLAREVNIPVFALGGMKPEDLSICREHQGFGIAGISAFTTR